MRMFTSIPWCQWKLDTGGIMISLYVSPRGLCNTISGGGAIAQHFCKDCRAGVVSGHLPSRNLERDSD